MPGRLDLLLVEGVGATRRELSPLLDVRVWVQADPVAARQRGLARDEVLHGRSPEEAAQEWDDWMSEEEPHLARDRPWERADLLVAGTHVGVRAGAEDVVVAVRSPLLERG